MCGICISSRQTGAGNGANRSTDRTQECTQYPLRVSDRGNGVLPAPVYPNRPPQIVTGNSVAPLISPVREVRTGTTARKESRWPRQDLYTNNTNNNNNNNNNPQPINPAEEARAGACYVCQSAYRPPEAERILASWRTQWLANDGLTNEDAAGLDPSSPTIPTDPRQRAAYESLGRFSTHLRDSIPSVTGGTQPRELEPALLSLLQIAAGDRSAVARWIDGFADTPDPTDFYHVYQQEGGNTRFITCGNCASDRSSAVPEGVLPLPGAGSNTGLSSGNARLTATTRGPITRYSGGPLVNNGPVVALGLASGDISRFGATTLPASVYKTWDDWFSRYCGPYGIRIGSVALARSAQTPNLTLVRILGYAPQLLGVPDPYQDRTPEILTSIGAVGRQPFSVIAVPLYPPPSPPTQQDQRSASSNRDSTTVLRSQRLAPAAFAFDAVYPAFGAGPDGFALGGPYPFLDRIRAAQVREIVDGSVFVTTHGSICHARAAPARAEAIHT